MKIQSNNRTYAGRPIKFIKGIVVTFDNKCIGEVTDEQGTFLLDYYKNVLFPEGQVPKVIVLPTPSIKNSASAEEFKEKFALQNQIINSLKTEVARAKEGENIWRRKCEELLQENTLLKEKKIPEKIKEPKKEKVDVSNTKKDIEAKETKTELTKEEEQKALKIQLTAKKKNDLIAMAVELKLLKDEWEGLDKPDLIDYLIEKTNP